MIKYHLCNIWSGKKQQQLEQENRIVKNCWHCPSMMMTINHIDYDINQMRWKVLLYNQLIVWQAKRNVHLKLLELSKVNSDNGDVKSW